MTRDERVAISILNAYKEGYESAIEDYKQEPCDECRYKRTSICGNCKEYDEYEPCTDAVSREAVINIVKLRWDYYKNCIEAIEKLPSVMQKSGKWIDREEYDADRWKCSECGRTVLWQEKFCPNCGAKMVEPQESEE